MSITTVSVHVDGVAFSFRAEESGFWFRLRYRGRRATAAEEAAEEEAEVLLAKTGRLLACYSAVEADRTVHDHGASTTRRLSAARAVAYFTLQRSERMQQTRRDYDRIVAALNALRQLRPAAAEGGFMAAWREVDSLASTALRAVEANLLTQRAELSSALTESEKAALVVP